MYLNLVQGSWETPEQLLLLLHLLYGLRIGLVIAPTGADTVKLVLWCCVPWAWPTLALLGDPESAEGPTGSLRPGHGSPHAPAASQLAPLSRRMPPVSFMASQNALGL